MDYTTKTNEELITLITAGDEAAYEQLFRNIRPINLHEAAMYQHKMETYDTEDFIQEGNIVAWEIISRGNYSPEHGRFAVYFGAAIRKRLIRIWRDYTLKNMICIGEHEDYSGNVSRILVESDYAKEYRIKKAAQQKRWYEKKKAEQALINPPKPKKAPKAPETKEERSRRVMAYQKAYYAAHPDKLAERREKNRIRERERRAAKKAAAIKAAQAIQATQSVQATAEA